MAHYESSKIKFNLHKENTFIINPKCYWIDPFHNSLLHLKEILKFPISIYMTKYDMISHKFQTGVFSKISQLVSLLVGYPEIYSK